MADELKEGQHLFPLKWTGEQLTMCVVVLSATLSISTDAQVGPTLRVRDYKPPPDTMAEMFDYAKLVALVAPTGQRVRTRVDTTGRSKVETEYSLSIVEVFKADDTSVAQRRAVEVIWPVGTTTDADGRQHTSRSQDIPDLAAGSDYIVFLEQFSDESYGPAFGPSGVFPIVGSLVVVPARVRQWSQFGGQGKISRASMLGTLRELRDRRQ
jgi:hypothetical protein